ncbi:MAG: Gfo/Idh/MocA family oxidoreductase [Bacteroidales bacterium]|nr:Gfo/Idh/MocA family oxidoreductase [Bacteroidales bacterium]
MPKSPSRRTFGKAAAGTVALTASSYRAIAGANDRVRLGCIGVGNRGDQLLDAFLVHKDCQVDAICDAYEPYLEPANKKAGGHAKLFKDYRQLLAHNGLDAIVIATPDHWHALQFVDACRAGKDVYVEKPSSLTVAEGRVMCRVAEETKRITQVGLHRRSIPYIREAVDLIRSGAIGKVTVAKAFFHRNESPMGIGKPANSEPPAGLDWDLWLGPAKQSAFNANKCLYKFRWFWEYSGGQVTNMGTHYLDVIQWAIGQDAPKAVACLGGKYVVDDNREVPDTCESIWQYDNCLATFSQINGNGARGGAKGWNLEFRGTLGTMYISDGTAGYEIVPESVREEELPALSPIDRAGNSRQGRATKIARKPASNKGPAGTDFHTRNFLDSVKSRKPAHCPMETGHRSTTSTILTRLALQRGGLIHWDGTAERVTNDEAANALLSYEYRKPWKLA